MIQRTGCDEVMSGGGFPHTTVHPSYQHLCTAPCAQHLYPPSMYVCIWLGKLHLLPATKHSRGEIAPCSSCVGQSLRCSKV